MAMRERPLWRWRSEPGAEELDLVGLGENSLDRVYEVPELPKPGGKLEVSDWREEPGGQTATAVLGCARLGLRCAYLGAVGADAAARRILAPLEAAGVDCTGVRTRPGARSRSALIFVAREGGERTVVGLRDPELRLAPEDVGDRALTRGAVLLLDARDPDLSEWAAGRARERGIPVVLDADLAWPGVDSLLARVDFPIVARPFAEEYGGTGRVRDGLRALASGGARLAVVTLGEHGAIAAHGEEVLETPAFEVDVRDTTGAGDAFRAGFIRGLRDGLGARGALRMGHAVAALNCRAAGAQGGLPGRDELERFLHERAS